MNYFDFHVHPTLKTILKADLPYNTKIPANAVSGIVGLCTDLPQIVASQAHISQLQKFGTCVIGVALYGIEKVIAADKTLKEIATTNKKLGKYIDGSRLDQLRDNAVKSYDVIKNEVLPVFENQPEFHILKSPADLDKLQPGKINVFFTIEGSHTLCNDDNEFFNPQEVVNNLRDITKRVSILSLNLTHLQNSNISNHAFGIQLTDNAPFIPKGNGMTPDADPIVQECFDKGICIDIKHMSLVARRQLFQKIKAGHYNHPQPVICTHAGFTGISISDIPNYVIAFQVHHNSVKVVYGKPNHIQNNITHRQRPAPTFNASSINLYDEEIADIVRNGGMIGLSMDRRICGFVSQFDEDPYAFVDGTTYLVDKEFFSLAEFDQLNIRTDNIGSKISLGWCNEKEDLLEVFNPPSRLVAFHMEQQMLQVKHYLQVCLNHGIPLEQATKQVCIGSDFDGIINPFYSAMTVEEIKDVRRYFKNNFRNFLSRYADSDQWRKKLDIPAFLDDLFYNNGVNFVRARLAVMEGVVV